MQRNIINFLLFQAGWFVCVIGGNWYALAYTTAALFLHHRYVVRRRQEWWLVITIAAIGCLWDVVISLNGVIQFSGAVVIGLPLWLVCLWLLFATTLHHSLSWLSRHMWVAVVCAALLAPASYWAGGQLNGSLIRSPLVESLLVIAAGWVVIFSLAIYSVDRSEVNT